ncbi:MAG: putative sulfate exporter family transporter [Gammaproteobacteria bacterium]|nr:putative sulfate exporter family transporter [Gammaproteobacteria bacterium]MBU2677942.1 putative sulfate exporter family transporter [Gammaproteobacteria bacterium]NNC56466.1 putative sulfate exporter family transporter [Woeseiaceae bacterium]NNL51676.1 putative sulfate exporter family transporter [Woeseiaceae bacterium]
MAVLPGLILALVLAFAGQFLSEFIGKDLMGLPKSPVSAIMMAIILGIIIRNTFTLPATFQAGIRFGLVRVLRLGIVLLGIRLSLAEAGAIGLQALPVIIGAVAAALLVVTYLARKLGLSGKLGTLIAVGTSICGATAIVATAPTIAARDDEVAYSVACITLFGVIAMLLYPFAAHWIFSGDTFQSGLFLGTSVHETAQVAGAGLVYQQYYGDPRALDVATVTKLVRNLGMLVVIPLMSILYHRSSTDGTQAPKWWTMVPLFVIGFACMSLLRTVGDMGDTPFGVLEPGTWKAMVSYTKEAAEICLAVAMAAVGLGTSIKGLKNIGLKPLGVGLFSAVLVGVVSISLIEVLY